MGGEKEIIKPQQQQCVASCIVIRTTEMLGIRDIASSSTNKQMWIVANSKKHCTPLGP